MRVLITGANGFAAKYLKAELVQFGYEVIGIDCIKSEQVDEIDILDFCAMKDYIQCKKPDIIYHLAGFTSVSQSWQQPQDTFMLNVVGSINVLEAVKAVDTNIKIVLIGSSDHYGKINLEDNPLKENNIMNPISPYAISKRTQEDIGKMYHDVYNMKVYMTRTFNYIGIGQRLGFVVMDFANGIVEAESSEAAMIKVGNLSSKRCFTDVRDVMRAYRLIVEKGKTGVVYNVGSNKVYEIGEILNLFLRFAKKEIQVERDEQKVRAFDAPYLQCDSTLLTKDTGWEPTIPIEQTLREILEYFRQQKRGSQ